MAKLSDPDARAGSARRCDERGLVPCCQLEWVAILGGRHFEVTAG